MARLLVCRQPCAAMLENLRLVDLRTGSRRDEGRHRLPRRFVRYADNSDFLDGGKLGNHLLDLDRVDAFRLGVDEIPRASGEPDMALVVTPGKIARMPPAVAR